MASTEEYRARYADLIKKVGLQLADTLERETNDGEADENWVEEAVEAYKLDERRADALRAALINTTDLYLGYDPAHKEWMATEMLTESLEEMDWAEFEALADDSERESWLYSYLYDVESDGDHYFNTKAMIRGRWFDLEDPSIEEALRDLVDNPENFNESMFAWHVGRIFQNREEDQNTDEYTEDALWEDIAQRPDLPGSLEQAYETKKIWLEWTEERAAWVRETIAHIILTSDWFKENRPSARMGDEEVLAEDALDWYEDNLKDGSWHLVCTWTDGTHHFESEDAMVEHYKALEDESGL